MVKVKLFWKPDCPICPAAKALIANIDVDNVEYYNLDEANGLAEAVFYGIMSTPSIVITNDNGKEIHSWRGELPSLDELQKCLQKP
ncbi:MAG: thioredoxin family protein [Actinomycetota bacterium]|nr:thioredoxin family protein [Actinomycetota bacterium]